MYIEPTYTHNTHSHIQNHTYKYTGSIIWPAAARGVWPQRIRLPRLVHPRYASPLHSSSRHTTSPGAPTLPTPPPPPLVTAAAATPGATRATPGATRATVGAAAPGAAGGSLNTPGIHINPLSTSTPLPISTPPVQRPPPSAPTPPHDASHDASPLRPGLVVQQALENAAGGLENERGHGLAGGASVGVGPPGTPGRSWLGVTQGGVGVGSQGTREQREQVERDEAIVRQLLPLGLFRPRYILSMCVCVCVLCVLCVMYSVCVCVCVLCVCVCFCVYCVLFIGDICCYWFIGHPHVHTHVQTHTHTSVTHTALPTIPTTTQSTS